jgi:hypothetical protein
MKAIFVVKVQYGTPQMYPSNDVAETICRLTGKKTATVNDLTLARKLGIQCDVQEDVSHAARIRQQLAEAA